MPGFDEAQEATPLPGLPCWFAGASAESPQAREIARLNRIVDNASEAASDFSPPTIPTKNPLTFAGHTAATLAILLLVVLLIAALVQGIIGLLQGSLLPALLFLIHCPYLFLAVKLRRWLHKASATKLPKVQLGDIQLRGYLRGQIRNGGVYFNEVKTLPWTAFTGYAFVGEADGYFVTRLIKSQASAEVAPALSVRERLKSMVNGIKAETGPEFLVLVLPGVATAVLAVVCFLSSPPQPAVSSVYCVLALHLLLGGFLVTRVMKVATDDTHTAPAGAKRDLYLLFDSRDVSAQEVMRRLQQYAPGDTGNR